MNWKTGLIPSMVEELGELHRAKDAHSVDDALITGCSCAFCSGLFTVGPDIVSYDYALPSGYRFPSKE